MAFQRLFATGSLIVGLLLLVLKLTPGQGTNKAPDVTSLSDDDLKTLTIQLERSACYGVCPAYSVTIHGDGRVEYNGKSHVKETGAHVGQIATEKIKALALEFTKAKYWELDEDYSGKKCKGFCTDMATAVSEIKVKGVTHRVKHYYGCGGVPKSLLELESSIDKTADSQQWTGDVSKAGPFGTTCF